jgi:formate dehydrogenase maturation protein FdhE
VKATAKKLATLLKASPARDTNTAVFIADLAKLMQLAAAKGPHTDLVAVAEVAKRFGGHSANDLIALMNKPKPPAKKAAAKTDPAQLKHLADDLVAAGRSKAEFDTVLATIEKLKKADLNEVANIYLGYQVSYKTKGDALKAMRSRHQQDALEESRASGMRALTN